MLNFFCSLWISVTNQGPWRGCIVCDLKIHPTRRTKWITSGYEVIQTCQLALECLQLLRRRALLFQHREQLVRRLLSSQMCSSVLSGHLTDSECNQRHISKKGSLADRKRSSSRSRRKGDEAQSSGYHSEGKKHYFIWNINTFLNVFKILRVYVHFFSRFLRHSILSCLCFCVCVFILLFKDCMKMLWVGLLA